MIYLTSNENLQFVALFHSYESCTTLKVHVISLNVDFFYFDVVNLVFYIQVVNFGDKRSTRVNSNLLF